MCRNNTEQEYRQYLDAMIQDIIKQGINPDSEAIEAMRHVPRHLFCRSSEIKEAYGDYPLGISCQQTISQPYMVALMTDLLGPLKGRKVLEIGTGSGYQAAVLAEAGAYVYSVERHTVLFETARQLLNELYPERVFCFAGNGYSGLAEFAPYDGIIVTAYAPEMPAAYKEQLAVGGRMVIPVGGKGVQRLKICEYTGDGKYSCRESIACRFVPLVDGGCL